MAAEELKAFLELGNIYNSTNFPAVQLEASGKARATIAYQKDSGALEKALEIIKPANYVSADRGDLGYAICELDACICDKLAELQGISGVLKVRAL